MPSKSRRNDAKFSPRKRALRYARRGMMVLPVQGVEEKICSCSKGTKCDRPGKHPAIKNGVHAATKDPAIIKNYWPEGSKLNIAIATGAVSKLLVFDIDSRHGGEATLAKLEAELGQLPDTLRVNSGGGFHLYFSWKEGAVPSDTSGRLLGRGVDVMGDGRYVVAPASHHVSGKRYRWINWSKEKEAWPLPEAWIKKITADGSAERNKENAVHEGGRNVHLTSLAGSLHARGLAQQVVLEDLLNENAKVCLPPLRQSEVEEIVASVTRYGRKASKADRIQTIAREVLEKSFAGGRHLVTGRDKQLWNFTSKMWEPLDEQVLRKQLLEAFNSSGFAGERDAVPTISQIMEILRIESAREGDPLRFSDKPLPVINCANGELWLDGDTPVLKPHDPMSYLTTCLPVEYRPDAKCELFDEALAKIFDGKKSLVRHWHEFVGYLIQPSRRRATIVILYGRGSNGKTVLMQTVQHLVGRDHVVSQPLSALTSSRFATAALFGKLIFIDDDMKAGSRLPDGELKRLSEEKEITAERKHGAQFNFVNRAVPVLLCNNLPTLADVSLGMTRRLMVIPFRKSFTLEEQDPDLFKRIWETELSGVLNHAVRGFMRFKAREMKWRLPKRVLNGNARFLEYANPVVAFIEERCSATSESSVSTALLYQEYKKWTVQKGITLAKQQITFARDLEHLGYRQGRSSRGMVMHGLELR